MLQAILETPLRAFAQADLGLCRDYIGVYRVYRKNGEESGNYYSRMGYILGLSALGFAPYSPYYPLMMQSVPRVSRAHLVPGKHGDYKATS